MTTQITPNEFMQSDLDKSGLSPAMQMAMGCVAGGKIQLDQWLDRTLQVPLNEVGYTIPYFSYNGILSPSDFNLRLSRGEQAADEPGKFRKYIRKEGSINRLYMPPGLAALSSDTLIVTEGEKKAAKAVQEGYACVAIAGVWNWLDSAGRSMEREEGLSVTMQSPVIPDLLEILPRYKKIVLLFDSDTASNPSVKSALFYLSNALLYNDAVWVITKYCDELSGVKTGLDDWLIQEPVKFRDAFDSWKTLSSERLMPHIAFPYARSSSGKPLRYMVPAATKSASYQVHRVLKEEEKKDEEGNVQIVTTQISHNSVWLSRVVNCIDDNTTLYEMSTVPLASSDVITFSGGAEIINLGGRGTAETYGERGAPLLAKERPALEEFFHHCQTYGVRSGYVRTVPGTRRRGWLDWNNEMLYLMASRVVSPTQRYAVTARNIPVLPVEGASGDNVLRQALRPKGNYDTWRDAVLRLILPNPVPALFMSAGLAGLLRRFCESENFVLHLYSNSSGGKTTALKAAASLWGNPDKLIDPWRATDNGLEGRCVSRNDMSMFLDEAGQAVNEDVLKNSAYLIGNGGEKIRATRDGSDRQSRQFRLVALSTGERALLRGSRQAGQEVRILDLPTHIVEGKFWDNTIHSAEDAEGLTRILSENHGFAADRAIRFILERELSEPGFFNKFHAGVTDKMRRSMTDAPPHLVRRVKHYGLLLTAYYVLLSVLEIEEEEVLRMLEELVFKVMRHMLRLISDQFSGGEKMGLLEHLQNSVVTHLAQHFYISSGGDDPRREVWGRAEVDGNNSVMKLFVLPGHLHELCDPFDSSRMLQALIDCGALIKSSRRDKKINHNVGGQVTTCYGIDFAVLRKAVKELEGAADVHNSDDSEEASA